MDSRGPLDPAASAHGAPPPPPPPPPKWNAALEAPMQGFLSQHRYRKALASLQNDIVASHPASPTTGPTSGSRSSRTSVLPSPSAHYDPDNMAAMATFLRDFDLVERTTLMAMGRIPEGNALTDATETTLLTTDYLTLRQRQNAEWARDIVKEGVALEKKEDPVGAMTKFQAALEVDARCTEALVARARAFANQGQSTRAMRDFEAVLDIDPTHEQAADLLAALRKRHVAAEAEMASAKEGAFLLAYDAAAPAAAPPDSKRAKLAR